MLSACHSLLSYILFPFIDPLAPWRSFPFFCAFLSFCSTKLQAKYAPNRTKSAHFATDSIFRMMSLFELTRSSYLEFIPIILSKIDTIRKWSIRNPSLQRSAL